MSTETTAPPTETPEVLRDERIVYGAVHLDVVDLERSLAFWRDLIGLAELAGDGGEARLGVDGRTLVVLHPGAERPASRGHAGLYHLAIHVADAFEFARALARIGQARVAQSPTDHIMSKATYLTDPDGILLEITLETSERFRSMEVGPGGPYVMDSEGRRRGGAEALDIAAALAPLGDGEAAGPLGSGSYIGHVHLHVPDLRVANDFYRDVIGFSEHSFLTAIGMADLSAGGRFPHRLAVNDWNGPAAVQRPSGTAGMSHYELVLKGAGELERLAGHTGASELEAGDGGRRSLSLLDPAGNRIVASAPAR